MTHCAEVYYKQYPPIRCHAKVRGLIDDKATFFSHRYRFSLVLEESFVYYLKSSREF